MKQAIIHQLVSQYLPQHTQLSQNLLAAQANLIAQSLPKVVVYGVYNAGKSSLLNALTGHVEHEYFATRDIPETKVTKVLEQQGLCYIDTPGLDVNDEDTNSANAGLAEADIVIFVHKLTTGPIQEADLRIMQNKLQLHGNPEQVLCVITAAEDADQQKALVSDIKAQLQQLAPNAQPYLVSNNRFIKGVREAKQTLIEKSGMLHLIDDLQNKTKAVKANLLEQRLQQKKRLQQEMIDGIEARELALQAQVMKAETSNEIAKQQFVSAVQGMQLKILESKLASL